MQQHLSFCSWRPAERPLVATAKLQFTVSTYATGWQTALARSPKIRLASFSCAPETLPVLSLPCAGPPVKSFSFRFPEAGPWCHVPLRSLQSATGPARDRSRSGAASRSKTRIAPPKDIIKLEDRLYYVLQPPLETMLAAGSIVFPFEPFPYQLQGVAFLYPRHAAILADEMGLGKTIQAIITIRLLLHAGEIRRVLLVCPKPLVTNWRREFTLWAPEVPLSVVEGDKDRRAWQWRQRQTPITIANYELLMRDRAVLDEAEIPFDLVVLDEAQRIKNRSSATNQVVRSVTRSRSWALTGTPVENSPEDLVGIFEFLSPGYLNRDMRPRRMGRAARDYILRRTKDMVLDDLPPRMFRDAEVTLTAEQWESYRTAEDEGVVRLTQMGAELTIQHVFELVLRLKQICNFDPVTAASSKLERLLADLEEVVASGQKAIIFSQWVQTLEKLAERLRRFGPLQYHGKIPPRRRDAIVDQFQADTSRRVLLMSYGAGSVGLNLQFCRYVFLFDRWWNPAIEDQAVGRAHRIGVAGPVTVTRMLTLDTIEERINQVLQEKRELFATIFSSADMPRSAALTHEEIFGLFQLQSPATINQQARGRNGIPALPHQPRRVG